MTTRTKYLFTHITLLNLLLIAVIILMASYTVLPLLNMQIRYTLPTQKKTIEQKGTETVEFSPPSSSDYIIVSEENLFHPERRIPPEKREEPPPLPKPELVLYGTVVSDTTSIAYVEDLKAPRTSPGRGKRQTALKIGDTVSGFTLKEIDTDKIVMVRGEEKMVVPVFDPQKPKNREIVTMAARPAATGQPARAPSPQPSSGGISHQAPAKQPTISRPKPVPSQGRAPMTRADEKIMQFFTR